MEIYWPGFLAKTQDGESFGKFLPRIFVKSEIILQKVLNPYK